MGSTLSACAPYCCLFGESKESKRKNTEEKGTQTEPHWEKGKDVLEERGKEEEEEEKEGAVVVLGTLGEVDWSIVTVQSQL